MDIVLQIWNKLITSNTFNFLVMLFLLVWIIKKFDLIDIISKSSQSIKKNIKDSELEKEKSSSNYNNVVKSVENLDSVISEHIKNAERKADDIRNEILLNASKKAEMINDNILKTIISEEKNASSRLISKTVEESTKTAKEKIIKILKEKPEIHQKIIEDSIKKLGLLCDEK